MVRIIRHNILPAMAVAGEGGGAAADAGHDVHPAVSIMVVSYNTREMTLACLRSVVAETRTTPYEIIVVDNASSDGSAEAIKGLGGRIRLMTLANNIGFARANNLAARAARGQYLLLLNPDTVVLDSAIDRLCAVANANPAAGIWGGRTLFGDRTLDPTSVWAKMTPWSLTCRALGLDHAFPASAVLNPEGIGGWNRDSMRTVDIVCGCFLLIRRELWTALDGFDRAFFMYGEEADLCLRAAGLGARPLFTPTATIIHYGSASEATKAGKVEKLFRAKVTQMRRHWSPPARLFGQAMLALWPLSRWLSAAAITLLRPSEKRAQQAALWREVWQSRAGWIGGWSEDGNARSRDAGKAMGRS